MAAGDPPLGVPGSPGGALRSTLWPEPMATSLANYRQQAAEPVAAPITPATRELTPAALEMQRLYGNLTPAAPRVARPERAWAEFSHDNDLPAHEARYLFERHIGDDPTQFMNEYVGPWRHPGKSRLTHAKEGEHDTFEIEPRLQHPETEKSMGSYKRKFRPHENEVYHDMLSLNREFQGLRTEKHSGIGNAIFDRNIDRMLKGTATPFHKVHAFAGLENGGYNWPGRGMLPDDWSWKHLRTRIIPHRIEHLKDNSDILPRHIRDVQSILDAYPEDPRGIWRLRALNEPITGDEYGSDQRRTMSLAKHLLRHQGFHVDLDLRNPEQMEYWRRSRKPEPSPSIVSPAKSADDKAAERLREALTELRRLLGWRPPG